MKMILLIISGLIFLLAFTIIIGKFINAEKYKIRSKAGIQKSQYLSIGGIKQYIQIRGQDVSNPVIVFLHGGPGSNMSYYAYGWQAELEKNYTIVHWDQRGCGNTYYRSPKAPKPTLDLLLTDLDELVDYIRLEYGQEKVIIMGHSWGTFPGAAYSGEHPEKVSAYVAVGQMVDFKESERISAQEAIRLAHLAGKEEDARKIEKSLESILACRNLDKTNAMELMKSRQLKEKYLPTQYGNRMNVYQLFSPYMTWSDLKWLLNFDKLIEANSGLYDGLFAEGRSSMYDYNLHYEVPVIMIAGSDDWTTPYCAALGYFNDISAPGKEFITIEGTGHVPFIDKAEEFTLALKKALDVLAPLQ